MTALDENVQTMPGLKDRALMSLLQHNEALAWFSLFDRDVEGAKLSFDLFVEARCARNLTEMMHHASCFICAVRRASRFLESRSNKRTCFRQPVAKVIQLEWKKKRTFFQSFRGPRDAIEHIDERVSGPRTFAFFNLYDDRLVVVDGASVEVNRRSLETLCSARNTIAQAIIEEYG